MRWDFNAGATTKFWCEARWGTTAYISTFPVFGDGVPKKSSTWRVNYLEKIRLFEDGKVKNDYRGSWLGNAFFKSR